MLSISNNNYSDLVLTISIIIVVFFLCFLYIVDIIQRKLTKSVTINQLARMPIRERYKYTRYVCIKCKKEFNRKSNKRDSPLFIRKKSRIFNNCKY